MQHVAKISCKNGAEIGGEGVSISLEELCSICYIISCIITLISVDSLLKLIFRIENKIFRKYYVKMPEKIRKPQSACGLQRS